MRRARIALVVGAALALAADPSAAEPPGEPAAAPAVPATPAPRANPLEALVPELARGAYRIESGPRPYRHRLAFSPGFGSLGRERLFTFRTAYSPNSWLGYEAALDHNPGQAVHAVLHSLSAIVRHPLPGRFQPYACAGYGMAMVFPGRSIRADPVTKNAVSAGGGLEFYLRGDLALRWEMRGARVIGRQRDRDGVVAYDYLQQTVGLSFYRTIQP